MARDVRGLGPKSGTNDPSEVGFTAGTSHVGGHDHHVHILGRFDPATTPSAVIGQVKQAATHWLHEEGFREFKWQRGFGAFSVSHDRVPAVIRYIQRQEEHHRKATFRDELEKLLAEFGVAIEDAHLL
jgi:putative transposase